MKFDLTFITQQDAGFENNIRYVSRNRTKDVVSDGVSLFEIAPPAVSFGQSQQTQQSLPPPSHRDSSTSVGSTRSASIPLPSCHIERTNSEVQLDIDEAAAEQREINMFYRMVKGIRERQLAAARPLPYEHPPRSNRYKNDYYQPHFHQNTQKLADPQELQHPKCQQQFYWQTPFPVTHGYVFDGSSCKGADGWSITGYDVDTSDGQRQREDEGDQGIFDIEL